ncbi:MAG: DUF5675 family protein [Ferruginibacter sp.]
MEIILKREYFKNGTNGSIVWPGGNVLLHTIELPWCDNRHGVSCIPEGRYRLSMRYSLRRKTHLLLEGVPGRSLILIHPANNALAELKGCIAPVSTITGEGQGAESVKAFRVLLTAVQNAILDGPVFLIIKSK